MAEAAEMDLFADAWWNWHLGRAFEIMTLNQNSTTFKSPWVSIM